MKFNRYFIASIASALSASAWAQSTPQALNLNLPPSSATTASKTVAPAKSTGNAAIAAVTTTAATTIQPAAQNQAQLGVQYDANANAIVDAADSRTPGCNDATYGKPQVHGSIGMGVVAGNHISGNYQTGSVNVTKALGSCDHPTGSVSLTINVGQGNFNGRNYRQRHW
ncbi:MAG: hypothetical protein ACREPN_05515 [Rudaea sp.]